MVVLDEKNKSCSGYKEQRISDFKLKLVREFLRMVEVAEAEVERHRRTEHFFFELQKYFVEQIDAMIEESKEKLSKETQECEAQFRRHEAVFIGIVSSLRQMKIGMSGQQRD